MNGPERYREAGPHVAGRKTCEIRGAIFYYSVTGNTALACRYIASRLPVPFELVDAIGRSDVDMDQFGVVGFAIPTDFWGVPQIFLSFVEGLARQEGKPAFVFNTFGGVSGRALPLLAAAVGARGFNVVAGHSLHAPNSYPPLIALGVGAPNAPTRADLAGLDEFVRELGTLVAAIRDGRPIEPKRVPFGLVDRVAPRRSRVTARDDMGEKFVDVDVCTECGSCARDCPRGAIRLEPQPVFDMSACCGCWRCYNRCPSHAVYTAKFRTGPYYPGPSIALTRKLGAASTGRREAVG